MTLTFLGEVAAAEPVAAELDAVLADRPAPRLRLSGAGTFGRALWLGVAGDLEVLARLAGDVDGTPVAIETAAGLLPAAIVAAGFRLFPINRSRCRTTATGTGRPRPRATPATRSCWPTSPAPTCRRTGRCPPTANWSRPSGCWLAPTRDAVGDRQQAQNKLRSLLREYYPAALTTLPDLSTVTARTALRLAPTPQAARSLEPGQLRAALVQAGRHTHLAPRSPGSSPSWAVSSCGSSPRWNTPWVSRHSRCSGCSTRPPPRSAGWRRP